MTNKLHDYQERAIEFGIKYKTVYFAVDLGMGKTAIMLEIIRRTKQPAFVFAPLRVIYTTWPKEISIWAPELSYHILHGPNKSIKGLEHIDIILMNYEGLPWLGRQAGKWKQRMIIYDESSMVKSPSTDRFKVYLKKMWPLWTGYKFCLSATPAPNSLSDLWSQYYILDRGDRLGKNISAFRQEYCSTFSYPGMAFTRYDIIPAKVPQLMDKISDITFRLDAKDYLKLPSIMYNNIVCQLNKADMKKYKELEQEFFLELAEADIEAANTALLGMKLRQFVQGGVYDENKRWIKIHNQKLKALQELLETSAGQPILCAIQFRGELQEILAACGDVPVIAGGTPLKVSQKYIDQWNQSKIPLLLCHPASLSHGVNLQHGGSIVLWYGLTWSLEQYLQLNGRLYRQGQTKPVVIHHLVMENTIDERVAQALASKEKIQTALLDYLKRGK